MANAVMASAYMESGDNRSVRISRLGWVMDTGYIAMLFSSTIHDEKMH